VARAAVGQPDAGSAAVAPTQPRWRGVCDRGARSNE